MSKSPEKAYGKILIVAGGDLRDPTFLDDMAKECDLIIAADGGLKHLLYLERPPDILIGDLDSLEPELVRIYKQKGIHLIEHPSEKDDTDTELAIQHALSLNPEEILLLGGIGDRIDHTLSNVGLLLYGLRQNIPMRLTDGLQSAFLTDDRAAVVGRIGDWVSLLPWTERVGGITTEGLKYPLIEGTLEWGHSLGISNELTAPRATVKISSGILLIVHIPNGLGRN